MNTSAHLLARYSDFFFISFFAATTYEESNYNLREIIYSDMPCFPNQAIRLSGMNWTGLYRLRELFFNDHCWNVEYILS